METKIYVVIGETGEYSDKMQWFVKAFKDSEEAEDFRTMCQMIADAYKNNFSYEDRFLLTLQSNNDPYFRMDYTGTYYTVEEVDYCE